MRTLGSLVFPPAPCRATAAFARSYPSVLRIAWYIRDLFLPSLVLSVFALFFVVSQTVLLGRLRRQAVIREFRCVLFAGLSSHMMHACANRLVCISLRCSGWHGSGNRVRTCDTTVVPLVLMQLLVVGVQRKKSVRIDTQPVFASYCCP